MQYIRVSYLCFFLTPLFVRRGGHADLCPPSVLLGQRGDGLLDFLRRPLLALGEQRAHLLGQLGGKEGGREGG